jgi:hypothetical protein
VVNVVAAPSLEPVHAQLRRLPFVTAGILEFDLVEVVRG